jgi:hypothetical protein
MLHRRLGDAYLSPARNVQVQFPAEPHKKGL